MIGNSLQSYPTCPAYKDDSAISGVIYAHIKTCDSYLESEEFASLGQDACLTIGIANKNTGAMLFLVQR